MIPLSPWYRGFTGKIEVDEKGKSFRVGGIWEREGDDTIRVTELPLGTWTQDYKKFLESALIGGSDGKVSSIS